jgi:hypothetical protein
MTNQKLIRPYVVALYSRVEKLSQLQIRPAAQPLWIAKARFRSWWFNPHA